LVYEKRRAVRHVDVFKVISHCKELSTGVDKILCILPGAR